MNPIITSLFTGNAIVVKSSEQTAWSSQYFASIVRGALEACGHSPHLVQSVVCWPNVAPHLISHPSISHITFIGSRTVAHHVVAAAAKSLTPVTVELGGKDAAIVLDDVKNLAQVSSILMRGVFQSAGQNCVGIERVIALPGVYNSLFENVASRIYNLRVGSALEDEENVDVGACISPANFDNLEKLIGDAVARGARLICGGSRIAHPKFPKGSYFAPTLLVDVTPDMPLAQQELFAPIFVLMRAVSVSDAISIVNSTEYALGCSVFGSSSKDLDQVTRQVRAGMVSVNDFASYYMCSLPFGGVKGSGYGRFGGVEGLRALCNTKAVCRDRFWGWIKTTIPARLDYVVEKVRIRGAMGTKAKAWYVAKGIVEVGYGLGFVAKVKGVEKLVKFM